MISHRRPSRNAASSCGMPLVLLLALAVSTGCNDGTKSRSVSLELSANGAEPSVLVGPDGIRLDIPAYASVADMTVVLTTEPRGHRPPRAGAVVGTPIELGPEGAEFGKQLELTVPIDASRIPAGKTMDDVVILTAPHGTTTYVPLPTRRRGNAVVATTTHFSDFVAVVPPVPVDPDDVTCPIPTTTWTFGGASSVVRSIVIASPSVYAVADAPMLAVPVYALSLTAGSPSGSPAQAERPASPLSTHLPRLQIVELGGQPQLFVSFLSGLFDPGTGPTEYPGGLVRVGATGASLPASAPLVSALSASFDGIVSDATGPRVLSWSALSSPTATLAPLSPGDTLGAGAPLVGATTPSERALPVHAAERLVGFVRGDEDGTVAGQHWTAWPVVDGVPGAPIAAPGAFVTFAVHDTQPVAYAVDSLGAVHSFAIDDTFQLTGRTLAQLPSGYAAASSSAKMVFTNGSVVFPATDASGALRLVRVRVASGRVEEWIEPDLSVIGWSALAAGDGVACYATSQNLVRCGCLAGAFTAVP